MPVPSSRFSSAGHRFERSGLSRLNKWYNEPDLIENRKLNVRKGSHRTPDSVTGYQKIIPNPQRLVEEPVADDYIVLTQRPTYQSDAGWENQAERPAYVQANKLRFLRPYQLTAIHRLQDAVKEMSWENRQGGKQSLGK